MGDNIAQWATDNGLKGFQDIAKTLTKTLAPKVNDHANEPPGELFSYQKTGIDFLAASSLALLADEMGLGKTVQAIKAADATGSKRILVICPAVAKVNWLREFKMWSNTHRKFKILTKISDRLAANESGICSFDYISINYLTIVNTGNFDTLIVDECHFLKSHTSKRTKAVLGRKGLVHNAKRTWFLSGTPAPNHAGELWVMLYAFGATAYKYATFIQRYCNTYHASYGLKITGTNHAHIPELKKLLSKIMLRRLKDDVMTELPPIKYSSVEVEPGEVVLEDQASFIQYFIPFDYRKDLINKLNTEASLLTNIYRAMKTEGGDSLKAIAAISNSVSTLRRYLGLQKVLPCAEIIDKRLHYGIKGSKIVIFAIHRDVIEGLRNALRKYNPVTLYGKTNPGKRQRNIDRFQNNPKCRVFIGNIQAAGTAITLTAANHVFFVEQDWVPGNNAQAIMRCHRIGQTKTVFVTFAGISDSLDTRIMSIVKTKTKDLTMIFDEKG